MSADNRDPLQVLRAELDFMNKGGYGSSPRDPWRTQLFFEDSPTCMNYDAGEKRDPCSDCMLMHWVPPESREEKVPCRHIPMNERGETLMSMYRWARQDEIEDVYRGWLKRSIQALESQRSAA